MSDYLKKSNRPQTFRKLSKPNLNRPDRNTTHIHSALIVTLDRLSLLFAQTKLTMLTNKLFIGFIYYIILYILYYCIYGTIRFCDDSTHLILHVPSMHPVCPKHVPSMHPVLVVIAKKHSSYNRDRTQV